MIKPFTTIAYRRWTNEEVETLKDVMIKGRQAGEPSQSLYEQIADRLGRSPSEVERKLVRLYQTDSDLQAIKQEDWSRKKILDQIKGLYLSGHPINKNALPEKLRYTLLKVVPPSAPAHRAWFNSIDEALAEAAFSCGYARNDDGSLDYDSPLRDMSDALKYIRLGHKKRHAWTLDEVRAILAALNEADYPITLPFLANHYNIYKNAINANRKLESFKDVIKKFIDDGSIKSYADLICGIAPDYANYYNADRSRLKLSTEEIRVKKFLDRFKIPYTIPRLSDKIATGLEEYANFVPDFIIVDASNKPLAIIEVFGSIGDRENAGVKELYNDKTQAKVDFYKSLPNLKLIEIYNNNGRCDLDDDNLFDKFGGYISLIKTANRSSKNPIVSIQDMLKIQCSEGNWNANPYMHGYANGLILALAVLEEKEPEFLEAPQEYLEKNAGKTASPLPALQAIRQHEYLPFKGPTGRGHDILTIAGITGRNNPSHIRTNRTTASFADIFQDLQFIDYIKQHSIFDKRVGFRLPDGAILILTLNPYPFSSEDVADFHQPYFADLGESEEFYVWEAVTILPEDGRTYSTKIYDYYDTTKKGCFLESLIVRSLSDMNLNLQKYGCTILYNPERSPKYSFVASGMQNLEFDSLFELSKLSPQNKALKSIIDRIIEQQKYRYKTPKDPVEQQKDYEPRNKPFDYEAERGLPIQNYLDTRFR